MRSLVAAIGLVVFVGAGCTNSSPTDLTLVAGDTLVMRQTVLGVGGELAELAGASEETRTLVVPDAWPSDSTSYTDQTFVLLPKELYAELTATGATHLSLGLYDQDISDALSTVDRLNALLAALGAGTVSVGEDPLRVTVDDADATDWVRLDGELVEVRAIEAKNAFASYVILANPDSPVILSLTLTPAARAELSALAAFEGFEISEIKRK